MPTPLITRENAVEFAHRSAESRRRNRAARIEQAARERQALEDLARITVPNDEYVQKRLARVRAQLDKIDAQLLNEHDPQRVERLAAASSRLAEQERVLAGRPAPGAYRPSAPRRRVEPEALVPE